MTLAELKRHLGQIEWRDVEFKKAQREVPKNARETVSAFSNTLGGHIVFGVEEQNGKFEIVGVLEPDKVQNDFLSQLRTGDVYSCVIGAEESLIKDGELIVLAFYIPEARREHKPVHFGKDLRNSYLRRGAGDERCNEEELRRLIRDAAQRSFDSELLTAFEADNFALPESVQWYRQEFRRKNPAHATDTLSDPEFLEHFGLIQLNDGKMTPTRGAVLLFGKPAAINRLMPRAIVDCRIHNVSFDDLLPEERWDHRELSIDRNLIETWRWMVQLFLERVADKSFQMDAQANLQRSDLPPDYIAFRESFLNLLIHQDFGDLSRKATIVFYKDRTVYWNSGASFVCGEEFFRAGDKEVRNPRIRTTLHRVGIGEQANSGIRAIYTNQRQLGRVPPIIDNRRDDQSFQVTLLKEQLVTPRQDAFREKIGAHLTDPEAAILLHAIQRTVVGPLEAASVAGLNGSDAVKALERLVTQQLLYREIEPTGEFFRPKPLVVDAFKATAPNLVTSRTDQVPHSTPNLVTPPADQVIARLSDTAKTILNRCQAARGISYLIDSMGFKNRSYFKKNHLDPLIEAGWLRPTYPENQFHPDQGYVLTDSGKTLVSRLAVQTNSPSTEPSHSGTDQAPPAESSPKSVG